MKVYSVKDQFKACLALESTSVSKIALSWGVDASTLHKVLDGATTSKNLTGKIKAYVKKSTLNKVFQ